MRKKAELFCAICDSAERMAWLVRATQAITQGDGPPTPAEVRSERLRFEREMRASDDDVARVRPRGHRPITDPGDRRRWLNWLLGGHSELRTPAHAPTVPVTGLVLYVLRSLVQQILEHDATLPAGERDAHFHDGTLVYRVVTLGRVAEQERLPRRHDIGRAALETPVLAQLLRLNQKLVRIRLRPAELVAEIAAARATGRVDWVSPHQLLWAAQHRRDTALISALKANGSAAGLEDHVMRRDA